MIDKETLISQIKNAIAVEKTTLQQMTVERDEVMKVLTKARFVDACDMHRIEGKFAAKIDNTQLDIEGMERNVKRMMDDA